MPSHATRILVDNSLSPLLAVGLSNLGFDAIHMKAVMDPSSSDDSVFDRAAVEDRVLIAADTDFGTILCQRRVSEPSVIIFRTTRKSTEYILGLIQANISRLIEDLEAGCVVVFEDARVRVRRLPIV